MTPPVTDAVAAGKVYGVPAPITVRAAAASAPAAITVGLPVILAQVADPLPPAGFSSRY
ncbi:hypothetical protein D3C75_1332940 [compost metagenome]